jgi:hypothetical protein
MPYRLPGKRVLSWATALAVRLYLAALRTKSASSEWDMTPRIILLIQIVDNIQEAGDILAYVNSCHHRQLLDEFLSYHTSGATVAWIACLLCSFVV